MKVQQVCLHPRLNQQKGEPRHGHAQPAPANERQQPPAEQHRAQNLGLKGENLRQRQRARVVEHLRRYAAGALDALREQPAADAEPVDGDEGQRRNDDAAAPLPIYQQRATEGSGGHRADDDHGELFANEEGCRHPKERWPVPSVASGAKKPCEQQRKPKHVGAQIKEERVDRDRSREQPRREQGCRQQPAAPARSLTERLQKSVMQEPRRRAERQSLSERQ